MRRYRLVSTALVVLALTASPALPQGRPAPAPVHTLSIRELLQDWLPELWGRVWTRGEAVRHDRQTSSTPRPTWAEAGCQLDPYGGCIAQPATLVHH